MISLIKPGKFKHRQALQCISTEHVLKKDWGEGGGGGGTTEF